MKTKFAIFFFTFLMTWHNSDAQVMGFANDSLYANALLKVYVLKDASILEFKHQSPKLHLKKKQVFKIAKMVLNHIYGRYKIRKQKPFHVYKINDYWIIWGDSGYLKRRKMYGGVFEMIINGQNGCVEMLSHGK